MGRIGRAWSLVKMTAEEMGHHPVLSMAGALAFFAMFGLPPLALLLLVGGGAVYGDEAARTGLLDTVEKEFGVEARATIAGVIENIPRPGEGELFTQVLAVAALLFGATAIFSELQGTLNTIWNAPSRRGWWYWVFLVVKRSITFVALLVSGLVVLADIGLSTILSAAPDDLAEVLPPSLVPLVTGTLQTAVSFLLTTIHFTLVFKVLPDPHVPWRSALYGAALTAGLFLVGRHFVLLYLRHGEVGTAFGAAGSLVVTLLWFYVAAIVVILGAVTSRAHARWREVMALVRGS